MPEKKHHWIKGIDSIWVFLALTVLFSHFRDPFVMLFKKSQVLTIHFTGMQVIHLFFGVAEVIGFFIISDFVICYPYRNDLNYNINYWQLGVSLTWLVGWQCRHLALPSPIKLTVCYKESIAKTYAYRLLTFGIDMFIFAIATIAKNKWSFKKEKLKTGDLIQWFLALDRNV